MIPETRERTRQTAVPWTALTSQQQARLTGELARLLCQYVQGSRQPVLRRAQEPASVRQKQEGPDEGHPQVAHHPKIDEQHRARQAYVYIRQSTLKQVSDHQESQDLQYQLAGRAEALGWRAEQIVVIDEDLGKSAVSSNGRSGFQRLFTAVGTGKVGLVLVTDVSRLARNCADWFQLLDLAAQQDVLVSDSGIYNPRAYDDRPSAAAVLPNHSTLHLPPHCRQRRLTPGGAGSQQPAAKTAAPLHPIPVHWAVKC